MKKFLLNDVTEAFLYLTTAFGVCICFLLGCAEAPDSIAIPIGVITMLLLMMCAYYSAWRSIMRKRGL